MTGGLMLNFPQPNILLIKLPAPIDFAAATAFLTALAVLFALAPGASAAAAETRLNAQYGVSIAGFPVGKAYLSYALNGQGYKVTGSARTSGVVRLFSDGHGRVSAKGRLNGVRPVPAAYTYDVTDDDGKETLKMAFSGNRVGKIELNPPENPEKLKRRVPLKRSHKIGVLDPLSALFIPADAGTVCNRTLPIFDGEQRFDLVLTRKRTDRFRGDKKNYAGKVVVCAISYRPIAGHRADKKEVKYMQRNSGMEIWMAPVGDTGVMAPVSGRLNTKIGPLIVHARRFQVN
jgi:hypothetical protein